MEKIPLSVYGLSYSQKQSTVYALILGQPDGPVRIPVVIGAAEAQAIAIRLERVTPPRPITHDLFASMAQAFGVMLKEVFIHKFQDGVFYCEMTLSDGDREVKIDSRTSDAVAIAMRTGSPIFTTREVLEETGFVLDNSDDGEDDGGEGELKATRSPRSVNTEPKLENLSVGELQKRLDRSIEAEDYEEAAKIKSILDRKQSGSQNDR